jgi:predicted GIY-YIG superfamily endonuclease
MIYKDFLKAHDGDHCCYMLGSIKHGERHRMYVGYTNNIKNRVRKHNGLIVGGAKKTRFHRPWVYKFVMVGFKNNIEALKFEWALQHPNKSKYLKRDKAKKLFLCKPTLEARTGALYRLLLHPTWRHVRMYKRVKRREVIVIN